MRGVLIAAIAIFAIASCKEPPARATAVGAVRVHTSIQDATLFVDAVARGPLEDGMEVELAPGAHVLEARRGDTTVARAPVEARSALIYDVELVEVAAPAIAVAAPPVPPVPPPAPIAPSPPVPALAPMEPTPAPPAAPSEGFLFINTTPWARVFIDGRDVGNTPVTRARVPAGPHVIELRTDDGQITRVDVTVRPGETEQIIRSLR